jgi:hypothetical protein
MVKAVLENAAWAQEIEDAARQIPDDDHARFLEALAEQKRISKESVRRQMGLDGCFARQDLCVYASGVVV